MSDETAVAAPATVPFLAKLKFLGIGALLGLVLGGAGAGKVWMDMSSSVSAATSAAAAATTDAAAKMTAASADLDSQKGQNRVLKARLASHAALFEFNRQNYGSAADQLKMVRSHLDALDPTVHKLDAAALTTAKAAAKSASIDAAGDLTVQAEVIRTMGGTLDALIK